MVRIAALSGGVRTDYRRQPAILALLFSALVNSISSETENGRAEQEIGTRFRRHNYPAKSRDGAGKDCNRSVDGLFHNVTWITVSSIRSASGTRTINRDIYLKMNKGTVTPLRVPISSCREKVRKLGEEDQTSTL